MMSDVLVDYYDEDKWGEKILTKDAIFDREKISLQMIKRHAKKNGKFLDVGCGIGYFLSHLKSIQPNMEYFGVDYSKYNLAKARHYAKVKWCDLNQNIPFDKSSFDTVYMAEVIEHLVDPDRVLREAHRVLKKKGTLIVTTPNLCSWYNRILLFFGIQPIFYETSTENPKIGAGLLKNIKQGTIPVGHIRIFTLKALTDQLDDKGFDVVAIKGAHFAALPSAVRWVDDLFKIYPRLASGFVVVAKKR